MPSPARHLATPTMVFASLGAAAVHAAVVPAHTEWQAAATFFAGLAMFQLCWALLVLVQPPRRGFLTLGVAVNAGTIALWLVSRTVGMPFGPDRGVPEAFARTDVLAALLEVAVVGAALWCARTGATAEGTTQGTAVAPGRQRQSPLATGATGALVSLVAIVALGGASEHHHHGVSEQNGHPGMSHVAAAHLH